MILILGKLKEMSVCMTLTIRYMKKLFRKIRFELYGKRKLGKVFKRIAIKIAEERAERYNQLLMDDLLYGFSVVDSITSERVDPVEFLKSQDMQDSIVSHYLNHPKRAIKK